MENKLIITEYNNKITSVLFNGNKPVDIRVSSKSNSFLVGDIYIGRVKEVQSGLKGIFIDIGDEICYYPLEEIKYAIFTKKQSKKDIAIGDELIVQISREAIKSKLPGLTSKISLSGKYLIYEPSSERTSISSKIFEPDRSRLKKTASKFPGKGYIIRTIACDAKDDDIINEAFILKENYDRMIDVSGRSDAFSCLFKSEEEYFDLIKRPGEYIPYVIKTDIPRIYDRIAEYCKKYDLKYLVELYEDKKLKLVDLYNFDKIITEVFHEKVWLRSGGYLVIECTEALTVIDVNTGKAQDSKSKDYFKKINTEAAVMIPYILRLRNISGIILVDFINQHDKKDIIEITDILSKELKKDPVNANYIDITSLQLVEIVRQKIRKPVIEYFNQKEN